jgi:solute carrier family 35, member E1
MPHSTSSGSRTREPSVSRSNARSYADPDNDTDSGLEKFPDHYDSPSFRASASRSVSPAVPAQNGYAIGLNGGAGAHLNGDRWQPRKERQPRKSVRFDHAGRGHHRQQKSISEAFNTIRERRGSVSQNAHEIADALRAPISPRLIVRLATRPKHTLPIIF